MQQEAGATSWVMRQGVFQTNKAAHSRYMHPSHFQTLRTGWAPASAAGTQVGHICIPGAHT